jgi:hypothetical protein
MYADAAEMVRRLGDFALAEQMRSAKGGRRGLFDVPSRRKPERNEFRSRVDERLSAVEPKHLSRAEAVSLIVPCPAL